MSIGAPEPTAFFIESDFLDFNKLEELKANREKPDWMTDDDYLDYLKGEDEWIYKMQKIALDAEERQQNLQLERDQKRADFKAQLKRKAIEVKKKQDEKNLQSFAKEIQKVSDQLEEGFLNVQSLL